MELGLNTFANEEWYRDLGKKLKRSYQAQSTELGEEMQNKLEAMSVEDLAVIYNALFLMGNYKDRTLLTTELNITALGEFQR